MLRKLRTNVPSLSGLIDPIVARQPGQQEQQSQQAQRQRATQTQQVRHGQQSRQQRAAGAQEEVPGRQVAPEPQSARQQRGASELNVPRSRSGSLLERMRASRSDDLSDTPQEWLDVSDDFEARDAGRKRGSWESFRDDQYADNDGFDDLGTAEKPATSRRARHGGHEVRKTMPTAPRGPNFLRNPLNLRKSERGKAERTPACSSAMSTCFPVRSPMQTR